MRGGSLLLFFCSCFIFSLPLRSDRGRFSRLLFFPSLSLLLFVFFGCSDGMEREACVCDHGYERSDLCAEIIIIIIIITTTTVDALYLTPPPAVINVTRSNSMYVCIVITSYSRVWINRVRLPILLAVS